MSRRLWIGAAAALALLVVAAGGLLLALDGIVQRALERRGSEMFGTAVHIDEVHIALHRGTGSVRGVHVANPPGFTAPEALRLDGVTVEVDLLTAFSSPTVVNAIRLEGPRVFFELDAQGGSNLDVIRRHLEHKPEEPRSAPPLTAPTSGSVNAGAPTTPAIASSGTSASATAAATASPLVSPATPRAVAAPRRRHGDGGGNGRRYIVSLLTLHDGEVYLDARATGGPQRTESLPGFDLTGIGADRPGGATPRQIVRKVATAIARDVAVSAAASQLEKWLGKDLGGVVGGYLKKGGAGAIGQGLDGMLEKLLKR